MLSTSAVLYNERILELCQVEVYSIAEAKDLIDDLIAEIADSASKGWMKPEVRMAAENRIQNLVMQIGNSLLSDNDS